MAAAASSVLVDEKYSRGAVWKYFGFVPNQDGEAKDASKPVCKRCFRTVPVTGANTTNLTKHLKERHFGLYRELYKIESVPKVLLDTVENLGQEDLEIFQQHLINGVEEFPRILKALLEGADRLDTLDKMIQRYGRSGALQITLAILKKMKEIELFEEVYMMENIQEVLLDTLRELKQKDLQIFHWHLINGVEGFPCIPKALLERADRLDTVDKMIRRYGRSGAVRITQAVLKKMNQIQLSDELYKMADIPKVLRVTVENMGQADLKIFQGHLIGCMEGFPCVPEAPLKKTDILHTMDEMIQRYGQSGAVKIVKAILKMNYKEVQLSEEPWTKFKDGKECSGDSDRFCDSFSTSLHLDTKDLSSIKREIFKPEMVDNSLGNKITASYRFLCPHPGHFQCKVTGLVFVMEGKGEVLYRIDSWDTQQLDGLGQMRPAGPLYNIECFKGPISHLHFPHCEILSEKNKVKQAVAHFTDDNVEIITPLKVTSTHVIIHIQGLSLLGVISDLRDLLFKPCPINAQVLLFYKTVAVTQRCNVVYFHLLPGNIPVEEVMKKHQCNKYIQTTSKCQLTPGRKYKPSCHPHEYQPEVETFEYDFCLNFHPTFEVFLDCNTENVRIGLLDEDGQAVWKPRLVFLTDNSTEATSPTVAVAAVKFVDEHRATLIQRVSYVMEIVDHLLSKEMISKEMYNKIREEKTSQEQMRILYDGLHSGGAAVKAEFYKILKKKQPYLMDELEAGPSRT
ncbi:caspase recruitment domain-containing protein 8-like isoform X2 [Colossoma macropomum]|uniref:caspase recruitment domain-containing protein 8-like isoform X2 n=1 Tax=Colossoma macropomum TaxID=42526 RepID=UPI0018641E99|nr:caspase recruitment domain-containing protein 8-like isoform X2 [Colossoma macropomum]